MKSYSIGTLLLATALLAMICGWALDHAKLNSKIQMLKSTFERQDYQRSEISYGGSIRTKDEPDDFLFFGQNYHGLETQVQLEQLEACPRWQARAPNPPVSASDAIRQADAAIPTLSFPGPDGNWHREATTLTQIGKHWCWVVSYNESENSSLTGDFNIMVLMDGSVLKPHYSGRGHPYAYHESE